MRAIEVLESSQVSEARRVAVELAKIQGFDVESAGRVAIVVTELATNLIKHALGGRILIGRFDDTTGAGVECMSLDRGAGIANIVASLRDGHSTVGSQGTGLGAVTRASHFSEIYSRTGLGTAILARLQPGKPLSHKYQEYPNFGVVSIAIPGEDTCGDIWNIKSDEAGFSAMVADGLGHGPFAAEAAMVASRIFYRSSKTVPSTILSEMHPAMKSTRGAAVAVARLDRLNHRLIYAGVGNIGARIIDPDYDVRQLVSNNGTIGHVARNIRDFEYPIETGSLVILASDGLMTNWNLTEYPGLARRHPTLIAGVLYRDHFRGRDDVTILTCRVT